MAGDRDFDFLIWPPKNHGEKKKEDEAGISCRPHPLPAARALVVDLQSELNFTGPVALATHVSEGTQPTAGTAAPDN